MEQLFVINRYEADADPSIIDEKANINRVLEQFKNKKLSATEEPQKNSKKRKLSNGIIEKDVEVSTISEEVQQVAQQKTKRSRRSNTNKMNKLKKFADKSEQGPGTDESENIIKQYDSANSIASNSDQEEKQKDDKTNTKKGKLANGIIEKDVEVSITSDEVQQSAKQSRKRKRGSNARAIDEVDKFADNSEQVPGIAESENKTKQGDSITNSIASNSDQEEKQKDDKKNTKNCKLANDIIEKDVEVSTTSDEVQQSAKQSRKRKRGSNAHAIDEVDKFADNSEQVPCIDESENKTKLDSLTDKSIASNSEQKRKGKKRKRKSKNIIETETDIAEEVNGIGSDAEVEEMEKHTADSSGTGFTILGDNKFNKKNKVKRVLPKWLLNPTKIATSLQNLETKVSSIKELDKDLRKKLKSNNVKYFFPVQASVIPWLLRSNKHSSMMIPSDICVSAPTGSGKTLAFVLPVVQALKSYHIKKIRALVILPTQDLASQVFKAFKTYVDGTHLDVGLITGNCAFEIEDSGTESNSGLCKDILVCTPGRLVDYLKETNMLDLQHLQFLVIDEADRIMDNMQNNWLYHLEHHMQYNSNNLQSTKILNLLTMKHRPVQKLLFSATLSLDPEKLQQLSLFQPKLFTCVSDISSEAHINDDTYIGKYALPSELTEKYIQCNQNLKPLVLYKFIKDNQLNRIIIFTNSTDISKRLSILLQALFQDELKVQAIFSQVEANCRARLINDFISGNVNVIVCTDSYARGIDLPNVQCVISYTVPKFLRTYIHRVGRTARAGELGLAVTLVGTGFANKLTGLFKEKKSLEEVIISEKSLELFEDRYTAALKTLDSTVTKHKEEGFRKMMSAKKHKRRKMNSHVVKK